MLDSDYCILCSRIKIWPSTNSLVFIVLEQTPEKLVYKMRGHDLCSLHPPKRKREEDGLLIRLKRLVEGL